MNRKEYNLEIDFILAKFEKEQVFNRNQLLKAVESQYPAFKMSALKGVLDKMLKTGKIARKGRNAYSIPMERQKAQYSYQYSEKASKISDLLIQEYPKMDFRVWETIQLNAFLNHQLAHNTIFVEVEGFLVDFIYDKLRAEYGNGVLLCPPLDIFTRYWSDGMIVVTKLISESPKDKSCSQQITLEKMLVDLFANKLLKSMVSESEYQKIFEDVFASYIINESKLIRYAQRRNSDERIIQFITNQTMIKLTMEMEHVDRKKFHNRTYQGYPE